LPEPPPKDHKSRNSSQTINHMWGVSNAINHAWSSSESPPNQSPMRSTTLNHRSSSSISITSALLVQRTHNRSGYLKHLLLCAVCFLVIDAAILQPSHPADDALKSSVWRHQDFPDNDIDIQYSLSVVCCISWFCSYWQGQFTIPDPYAMIGRWSALLLPHPRQLSQLLHICSGRVQVVDASTEHLHGRWPCPLTFPQCHKSPALLFWYTMATVRTLADICKFDQ